MRYLLVVVVLSLSVSGYSQKLQLFNVDAEDYPNMKASFYSFDRAGERNLTLTKTGVTMKADGQERTVTSVVHPQPKEIVKLSVVFAVDISGSMGFNDNIGLARSGVSAFLKQMNFNHSDAAIISFESTAYIESGFTGDISRLQKAVSKLTPSGGTEYSAAFNHDRSGAMTLARETAKTPVIIFLTDGQGSVNSKEVINKATSTGAKVFTVCLNMKTPDCLAEIAKGTNGMSFGNVKSEQEIKDTYELIFRQVSGLKPSTISWVGETSCESTSSLQMTQKSPNASSNVLPYARERNQLKRLDFSPRLLEFNPDVKEQELVLKAVNGDIAVSKITTELSLLDITGFAPRTLKSGEEMKVKVALNSDPKGYKFGKVAVANNCAELNIVAMVQNANSSGLRNVHVDFPNGGEEFISGTPTSWKWSGAAGEPLKMAYSADNGVTWKPIKQRIKDNQIDWEVPAVNSKQVLFKVEPAKAQKGGKTQKSLINEFGTSESFVPDNQVYVSPLGNHLYGFSSSSPKIVDARTGEKLWPTSASSSSGAINYSVDGMYFYVGSGSRVDKYDATTMTKMASNQAPPSRNVGLNSVSHSYSNFASNGKYYLGYELNGKSSVYDLGTGQKLEDFPESGWARDKIHMTVSIDGKVMGFGSSGITIYNAETGKKVYTFDRKYVSGSIAPTGRFAVLGYKDKKGNRQLNVFALTSGSKLMGDQSDQVFTIISPKFEVDDAVFHQVEVGRGDDKLFVDILKNRSDVVFELKNVRITGQDSTCFRVISGNGPRTIEKLKNTGIELNFTPKKEGKHKAKMIVQTNYGLYEANITGEGIAPKLTFASTPSSSSSSSSGGSAFAKEIDLGKHLVGVVLDSIVGDVLVNSSKESITISKMELVSADDDQFKLNSKSSSIAKKKALELDLKFTAIRRGKTSARVKIYSPQLVRPATVSIYAEVIAPKIYEINLVAKSMASKRPVLHKYSTAAVESDEEIDKKSTKTGRLSFELPADHLYEFNTVSEDGTKSQQSVDLREHRPDKKIEVVVWVADVVRTDAADIMYTGQLLEEETGKSIKGKIVLRIQAGPRVDSTKGNEYTFTRSKTEEVKLYAYAKGYLPKAVMVEIDDSPKPNSYVLDIELVPIVAGKNIKLDNVLFEQGKPILLEGSDEQLYFLLSYMKENPESKMHILGHTDNQGSSKLNYVLSEERVETIQAWLIDHGIDKKRLSGKGYGPSQPIADNRKEETRKLNRRVEFKLME